MVSRRGRRAGSAIGGTLLLACAAVVVVRELASDDGPPTVPDEYRPAIEAAAGTCRQLSVPLLAAQIDAESGWRTDADSGHAQGISQFAPVTWKEWGRDGNGDGKAEVWDPQDAIPSQARYMCHLYETVREVPGDPTRLALAAYNAGPNAVLRAGGIPDIDETRGYVDRIVNDLLPGYRKSEAERASASPGTASSGTTSPGAGPSGAAASGSAPATAPAPGGTAAGAPTGATTP
ncbi:lytic transglycosylase domain-containing protein [Streptomyces sp. NPDC018031]|uniref:lytic transglycosylase domain-containing protein n=1 Tax=Streptomyces sp. NPDC018031 TaxID=3365033 RepID=UPI00379D5944